VSRAVHDGHRQEGRGNLLTGVRLRSSDQWGNESMTLTKAGSLNVGKYDFQRFRQMVRP